MCITVCIDMCVDMCIDLCTDMCVDMRDFNVVQSIGADTKTGMPGD